jgi:hypothetical protein
MTFIPASDERIKETTDLPTSGGPLSGFVENVMKEGSYSFATTATAAEHTLRGIRVEAEQYKYNKMVDQGKIDGPKIRDNPVMNVGNIGAFFGVSGRSDSALNEAFKPFRRANEQLGRNEFQLTNAQALDEELKKHIQSERRDIAQFRQREKTIGGTIGSFAGPLLTVFADPVDAATLGFGAKATSGVLRTATVEGLINAGAEIPQQPAVQDYRKRMGLEHGYDQALKNILSAGIGGFALGGGLKGLAKGGDELAKSLGIRNPGFERAGKVYAEAADEFPDSVTKKMKEGTMVREDYIEAVNHLKKRGQLSPQQETAYRIQKINQKLDELNPYENRDNPAVKQGHMESRQNIDLARESLEMRREPNINRAENTQPVRQRIDDFHTAKVKSEAVEADPVSTTFTRSDQELSPVVYRTSEGKNKVLFGKEKFGEGDVDAVVIDSDNATLDEAKAFTLARQLDEGQATQQNIADALGIDRDLLGDFDVGNFKKEVDELLELSDSAFREMVDNQIGTIKARRIATEFDDPETQARAMRLVDAADNQRELDTFIEQGKANGFGDEYSTDMIDKQNNILDEAISGLKDGRFEIQSGGESINVNEGFIKGLRQLSETGSPVARSLRYAGRESDSARSGAEQFIERLTDEFEQGNIGRDAIRETGAVKGAKEEVQQFFAKNPEDAIEEIQAIRRGESDQLDELETNVREQYGEEDTVKVKREDADGRTIEEELSVEERLAEFEDKKNQLQSVRECL